MPIEHISDTARWVAVYRAVESDRADALFRDPYARRLAGSRGEEIVREMGKDRAVASSVIVRTAVFDALILDAIANGGVDLVANLAAGLDSRPWRLPLPRSLRWIDLDLPAILEEKQEAMRDAEPSCRYEAEAADLTDDATRRALLERIGEGSSKALVVTEGLVFYLEANQVAALARDLADVGVFRRWILDLPNPELLGLMNRDWGAAMERGGAPFRFAPPEGTAFFEPCGWREAASHTFWDESHRLRRDMPRMWLWRFLTRFAPPDRRESLRRMMSYVALDRIE